MLYYSICQTGKVKRKASDTWFFSQHRLLLVCDKLHFPVNPRSNKTVTIRFNRGINMEEKLRCSPCGDYLIPDIQLAYEPTTPLGKYGRLRREYLRENNPILYNDLVLAEKLFPHLHEIDIAAKSRFVKVQILF